MKTKLSLLLLIAILSVCNPFSSKADAVSELSAVADMVNATCPLDMGIGGTISSVTFNKNSRSLIYHIQLNPNMVTKESFLAQGNAALKEALLSGFREEAMRPLMQLLYDATAQMVAEYNLKKEHLTDVILTTSDIRSILKSETSEVDAARKYLQTIVTNESANCPKEVGGGLLMTKMYINGNKLCYEYEIIDPAVQISQLRLLNADNRKNMLDLYSNDKTLTSLAHKMSLAGYTLNYIYIDPATKETYTLILTNEELSKIGNK